MAVVAKFVCNQVTEHGGRTLVPADPDEHGAFPVEDAEYRNAGWEPAGVTHVKWSNKASEEVKLRAVYSNEPGDPNHGWSTMTPAGSLEITIDNPGAWGYFKAGEEYRLEMTRFQPQKSRKQD